ncbi:hypothetical protein RV11_GL001923 [Enterococcus phoeniculicola]|nr:hypothetical protein RV11_GL001923 [Enterococcus phoeniculicola]
MREMGHIDAPKLNHLTMIDEHRLELYWDQEVEHSDVSKDYAVFLNQIPLDIERSRATEDEQWSVRPVYESHKKRTTLFLNEKIKKTQLDTLFVKIVGRVKNPDGLFASTDVLYTVKHWQDFYSLFTRTDSKIIIKSSLNVSREAHRKAAEIIDKQLQKIPQVAKVMESYQAELAIYGKNEDSYDIPEHRGGADILNRPVEGFGGVPDNPVTSISDKNILRIMEGPNQTRYLNECILVHEFGHAIHLIGINNLPDPTLANELKEAYQHAKNHHLWPNTYAISNEEEYFATLSTIWFNVMAESKDGTWDGVRGPVNCRAELKEYDPQGYEYFSKIYEEIDLPFPWNETPVFYPQRTK